MKRFTKVCLWIFGGCLVFGLLLASVSWALGFRGWRSWWPGNGHLEEVNEEVEGDIRGLDLHVQAGSVLVSEGDCFSITERTEGKPLYSVVEDGIWRLSAREQGYADGAALGGLYVDNEGIYWKAGLGEVHITIPRGVVLDEISIEVEGGEVEIDRFSCKNMEIEIQAGSVNFRGDVEERISVECQAGAVSGLLAGRPEDFNVDVECSVGSVTVGGSTWAGLFMDQEAGSGNRSKEMELSCEAGSIDLDFFEEE